MSSGKKNITVTLTEMKNSNTRLRILFVNGDLPVFPGWGGHDYLNMIHLAKFADVGLVSQIHTLEQKEKTGQLVEAGIRLYAWENPAMFANSPAVAHLSPARTWRGVARDIFNFFRALVMSNPADTYIQRYNFRNMAGVLLKALNEQHWDVVAIVQSSRAEWKKSLPDFFYSILVLHDVRALVYERQAKTSRNLLDKIFQYREFKRYKKFEKVACGMFDLALTVSPADEKWMRENYKITNVKTAVLPVDANYFLPLENVPEKEGLIVFTGMMNHPPNVDAAVYFAKEVFPAVRSRMPGAEFWIVGRDPVPEVRALAGMPGVTVTGTVPDIRHYIAQAAVVVVPLRFGAGMRNKILEAWGMQKFIISSSVGAEGLPYLDGENLCIADDTEAWVKSTVEGLANDEMRAHIKHNGRRLILEKHDPEKLARDYYEMVTAEVEKKRQADNPFAAFVDLRWMVPGLAGGIENLSRSFLNELCQLDHYNYYNVLVPGEVRFDFDTRQNPNIKFMYHETPGYYFDHLGSHVRNFLLRRVLKVDHWRSSEIELLHNLQKKQASIALSVPGYLFPDVYPLKNVLIVPDIQHEYFPQFFERHALAERRKIYTDSIRHADHLCAISEFTRQTLIDHLGIEPGRITTTHLAADPIYHPANRSKKIKGETARKYGLPVGGYLFFPGNTWPHKNHKAAFRALHILKEEHRLDPLLVCTGSAKNMHADLVAMLREFRLEKNVRFLGYCPSSDLPSLYEDAMATIFPSLFEGFGMPVVESMLCDCPVICSNTSSLPEIAGNAALLVDPNSPAAIADAIQRCITDSTLREVMIDRGRRQAANFSWRKFTLQIVDILHKTNSE